MRKITHMCRVVGSFLAVAGFLGMPAAPAVAAPHTSLPDPSKARCATCHDEILAGATVHPPAADDCLSCHEFARDEQGLTVELAASGSALCVMCHDSLAAAAGGELASPHAPVTDDCANCHSPHSSPNPSLLTTPPQELCFGCHDRAETDAGHGIPVSRGLCSSCHQPHGSESPHLLAGKEQHAPFAEGECEACHKQPRGTKVRLREEGAALCYACHGELEVEFSRGSVHGAVREGRCTGCHDPHLADRAKLLRAAGGELCFPCHAEIRAKVSGTGAHAPTADGCDGCHAPHNSEHAKQLVESVPALCLGCHDGDDPSLRAEHLGAELATAACTTCHDPHGSTAEHLLAGGSLHPPFVEGCDSCHEGSASELMAGGGNELCVACHSEIEELIADASVPHAAMEAAACTDCHSPHASPNRKLLLAPAGGVCTSCHDDMTPGQGMVEHGIIRWVGCEACHEPHGGNRPQLLRATGNQLCTGCHVQGDVRPNADGSITLPGEIVVSAARAGELKRVTLNPARTADHPVASHPVSGTVTEESARSVVPALVGEELSCRSCHEPHAARTEQLLAFGATSSFELCSACHPK